MTAATSASASASKPYLIPGPTSPQSSFLPCGQSYLLIPAFTLESGITLTDVPVAFKTWGKLDPATHANALLVAHALTGSADVEDWWGPLLGVGKLFDPTRFFVVCVNVLGSPYGSASPCTRSGGQDQHHHSEHPDWDGHGWWGPDFPATTVRDDVRIQKLVLDFLGVEQLAAVVGGSMGGMAVLEWPLCYPVRFPPQTPEEAAQLQQQQQASSSSSSSNGNASTSSSYPSQKPYIRALVPIATAARHSAWGISWAEAQRQSIYSDPLFQDGYYSLASPPRNGLSAARMAALLTYRSRDSFESRFGRRVGKPEKQQQQQQQQVQAQEQQQQQQTSTESQPSANGNGSPPPPTTNGLSNGHSHSQQQQSQPTSVSSTPGGGASRRSSSTNMHFSAAPAKIFSAQSYLRYQGDKFVKRFDANCYVHLTRKMDSHDVARGRHSWGRKRTGGGRGEETPGLGWEAEVEGGDPAISSAVLTTSLSSAEARAQAEQDELEALQRVLGTLSSSSSFSSARSNTRFGAPPPQVQIVSIESDGLFAPTEQILLHDLIAGSELVHVQSPDGHDGFLLEFEQINAAVGAFLQKTLATSAGEQGVAAVYEGNGVGWEEWKDWKGDHAAAAAVAAAAAAADAASRDADVNGTDGEAMPKIKESVFGEVEDVTRW
ncbi:homoserine O- acetyltransferase [Tilletia horrida]|uniref:Homoserine O- acetyltransferase n=1 Tax=Tilletia horrida TaxID=155126 RepID=A0AAN6GQB7_9BASI|nr:homoserine O- acetyltransferase [Tilletia horrida]